MADTRKILDERRKTHGSYEDHAECTQALLTIAHRSPNFWKVLTPRQKETIHMTFHKIARILTGDPNQVDHWQDIIGYNQLIVDYLGQPEYGASGPMTLQNVGAYGAEPGNTEAVNDRPDSRRPTI